MITTIIPTYNRSHLLKRAINSALNQTYRAIRVAVFDNASEDDTAKLVPELARHDPRICYFRHKKNIGLIPNFNFGINHIDTPYFSFLSDDNILIPNFYENAITYLEKHADVLFYVGETISVDARGHILHLSLKNWPSGIIYPPEGLLSIWQKGLPTWEGILFRREAIKQVDTLDAQVNGSADKDFIMKLARKNIFFISKQPAAVFVHHLASHSFNRKLIEVISSQKRILNRWLSDPDLTNSEKDWLIEGYKSFISKKIISYVYLGSILQRDEKLVKHALKSMREEIGFSLACFRMILLAKLLHFNKHLGDLLRPLIQNYLKHREKTSSEKISKLTDEKLIDTSILTDNS